MPVIGVEPGGHRRHNDRMLTLRHMILSLLLVILLPWHAHAAAIAARETAQAAAMADIGMPLQRMHSPEPEAGLTLPPRKCRTATLPGLSCAPDPAIHPVNGAGVPPGARSIFLTAGDWRAASAIGEPPTGPPRLN